ncbi:MAG: hypothetical protein SNJ77_04670 [Cytophagales bacterium]
MKIKKEKIEQGKKLLRLLGALLFLILVIIMVSSYFMDEAEKELLFDEDLELEDDIQYQKMLENH